MSVRPEIRKHSTCFNCGHWWCAIILCILGLKSVQMTDTLYPWKCWGEKKETLIPWLPGSLNLLSLQNCIWWDELITQTETRWSLESGKGCWVANVLKKAFFFSALPHLSNPFQFNSTNIYSNLTFSAISLSLVSTSGQKQMILLLTLAEDQ